MAVSNHRKRKYSLKRKIAIAGGILLSGAVVSGIATVTAQPDTGSRISDAPQTLPSVNRSEDMIAMPSLTAGNFVARAPDDQLLTTPLAGHQSSANHSGGQSEFSKDYSVKDRFEPPGNDPSVPLSNIANVLGNESPGNKIEGIAEDILGGGIVPPGESLKRSADTAFLLSGAGDGFPNSGNVEIARNSVLQNKAAQATSSKTTAANGVPAPAPLLLFGAGLAGLGFLRRYMRSAGP